MRLDMCVKGKLVRSYVLATCGLDFITFAVLQVCTWCMGDGKMGKIYVIIGLEVSAPILAFAVTQILNYITIISCYQFIRLLLKSI